MLQRTPVSLLPRKLAEGWRRFSHFNSSNSYFKSQASDDLSSLTWKIFLKNPISDSESEKTLRVNPLPFQFTGQGPEGSPELLYSEQLHRKLRTANDLGQKSALDQPEQEFRPARCVLGNRESSTLLEDLHAVGLRSANPLQKYETLGLHYGAIIRRSKFQPSAYTATQAE
ncbi:hypothetical protein K438DRAFT_1756711 [Mycena galopus ATCC 62051]|nr:hypothetical protein K438DRAFT_1756711 [Mycena galopus ATCC 62051]